MIFMAENHVILEIVQALISVQALVFDLAQLTCQKRFDCRNAILGSSGILLVGLELAIDPPPPRGNFVHYDFLKLRYIRHKIKDVSPL